MCESLSNLYGALESNDAELKKLMDKVSQVLPPHDHWNPACTVRSSWEELMSANKLNSERFETVMTSFFDVPVLPTEPQTTLGELWNSDYGGVCCDSRVFALFALDGEPNPIYGILVKLVLYLGRHPNEPIPSCMQAPVAESQSHPARPPLDGPEREADD